MIKRSERLNFRVGNERIDTEVLVKSQKGQTSALKGEVENAISGKHKDSVQKETPAVCATETICVERQHQRPLLFQGRRHKMTEEDLW